MVTNPAWRDDLPDSLYGGAARGDAWQERATAWFREACHARTGQTLLWTPVFLGSGIAGYFALAREPGWAVLAIAMVLAGCLFAFAWRARRPAIAVLLGVLALGFCLAKLHSEWLSTPQLAASSGAVTLKGWVARNLTTAGKNPKVVIEVDGITGIKHSAWPRFAQVRLFQTNAVPSVGEYLEISARLFPLPWPVAPGGYDHARFLWFEQIGATGRGKVVSVGGRHEHVVPWRYAWKRVVSDLRAAIGQRIAAAMPKQTAGLAVALVTGDKSLISNRQREEMAVAGLAHVLAISGLHMSLVAGGTFWLVRAILALFPMLALRWPIKKWAAVAAIGMGAAYLQISGAGISTQRAFIMLLIMFLAVLADRPAISLRNLAIAALVILVWTPHAVTTASFQMSFMAVMGLIAAYEAVARRRDRFRVAGPASSPAARSWRWLVRAIAALAFTTIIASVFSGLPAAYHFSRAAPLSLVSNLLALPVVSLVIMPAAVVASIAMPLGLESLPLQAMNQGLRWVVWVADYVNGLPYADIAVGRLAGGAVLIAAYGAIALCLLQASARLIGVAVAVPALWFAPIEKRPDILIEHAARNVAVRNADGVLVPAHARRARFSVERWLRNDGDTATLGEAAGRAGWRCEGGLCRALAGERQIVFMMKEAEDTNVACAEADIVIAQFPLRSRCRGASTRIDRFDVWRNGAYALYLRGVDEVEIETTRQVRGTRPWTLSPVARREVRTISASPRAPNLRAKSNDATPKRSRTQGE
jgi:competence protein ComEC